MKTKNTKRNAGYMPVSYYGKSTPRMPVPFPRLSFLSILISTCQAGRHSVYNHMTVGLVFVAGDWFQDLPRDLHSQPFCFTLFLHCHTVSLNCRLSTNLAPACLSFPGVYAASPARTLVLRPGNSVLTQHHRPNCVLRFQSRWRILLSCCVSLSPSP